MWRRVIVLGAAFLLGCGSPTEPVAGRVEVRLADAGMVATNHRPADIYFFLIERETAAVVDWMPCTEPAACPRIAANATLTVPYDSIFGWKGDSHEVLFYWWHLVPAAGGAYRPDSIRSVVAAR